MRYLDLTLPSPAENLAMDEALLDWAEAGEGEAILRVWEPTDCFVVMGYANRSGQEVDLKACRAANVPVFRRISGGGTVLQGPGCLNYTLVLEIEPNPELAGITTANQFIMQRHAQAMAELLRQPVQVQGHTDLTLGNLKFSGNSQRRKRRYLLFHGTFLLQFDLDRVGQLLRFPSRQPEYRQSRAHADFLTNLERPGSEVKAALRQTWQATAVSDALPTPRIEQLVQAKYSRPEWNQKFV